MTDYNARIVHCWMGRLEWIKETYGSMSDEYVSYLENDMPETCMLPDGHAGPHEWTRDDEIEISFGSEADDQ